MAVSAQHELTGYLLSNYADTLVPALAELAGIDAPGFDQVRPAPDRHQVRDGHPITTDTTVHLWRDGATRPGWFLQFEMQRDYEFGKLTTLRAYHGSEIRNVGCGGHTVVLSPSAAVKRQFQDNEERYRDEFAYRTAWVSGEDLAPFADPARRTEERVLAAGMTDFTTHSPAPALQVLEEIRDRDQTAADLLGRAIIEEAADQLRKEPQLLTAKTIEALDSLPFFQERKAQWAAEIQAAQAQASAAQAQASAAQAELEAVKLARVRQADLVSSFLAHGDKPSQAALHKIHACTDLELLAQWVGRANQGEASAQVLGV